ncbi:MAG: ribosome small subunit-dependent GTPase A [Candidatus Eisenbacteria bacterium]
MVATVVRIDFGGVRLLSDDGLAFEATVPGRMRGKRKVLGNAVVTGDRAHLSWEGERAVVESVEPRHNVFSRQAAGERKIEQVVAANLDRVIVVASIQRPEFRHGFVDRVLVQCERAGIPAFIALNKTDLDTHGEAADILAEYARAGVDGFAMCAHTGVGVEAVRERGARGRSMFVGHSGVGKSTLLNRLLPHEDITEGDVNEVTGKGRHTTTAAILYRPEPGLEVIDTPGVRAFALWGVDAAELVQYYPELAPHIGGCRFGDCRHDREPGCAMRAALARGEVGERRFASYCKLRDEIAAGHSEGY